MKISYNWLKELIDVDYSTDEMAEILTMLGFEVEEVIDYKKKYDGFITARVVKKEKHPDADKLSLCTVEYNGNSQTVICGAPNVRADLTIALGLSGATVPSAGFQLSKRKIRGIESNGMICSKAELELGDDHDGIWELPEDTPVGIPLSDYLDLNDVIFDIFITPNRSDGNSHIGIAKEIAAYSGKEVKMPEVHIDDSKGNVEDSVEIVIENQDACPRYMARVLRDVKIVESPDWLKNRLTALGLRPRNIAVDATNYVLHETGNPLHGFDLDEIGGNKIIVKNANESKFTTLDDKERELDSEMLMICDAEKAVAIAGVMGGQNSEIKDSTTNILIESAYFNPSSVRRTARKLSIKSDASYRFERGVDCDRLQFAADRCAYLITKYGGGYVEMGTIDNYPNPQIPPVVEVRFDRVRKLIGVELSNQEIIDIINRYSFEIIDSSEISIKVKSPTWRVDLNSEVDYIEEVARLYNYNEIKPRNYSKVDFSTEQVPDLLSTPKLRDKITKYLISNGFNECMTQNIVDPDSAKLASENTVDLSNALGSEMSVLRSSLIPSMLKVVERNINLRNLDLKLFEIGKSYQRDASKKFIEGINEQENLVVAFVGNYYNLQWAKPDRKVDFYDVKGLVEDMLKSFKLNNLNIKDNKNNKLFGVNSQGLFIKKNQIGSFGEIDPKILKKYNVDAPIVILELNLTELYNSQIQESKYSPVSPYPKSEKDLAFLVNKSVESGKIENLLIQNGGKILNEVFVFDKYEGKNIEGDQKSLAYRLVFSAKDRTLKDEEINQVINKMVKSVESQLEAKLRDY